HDRVADDGGIEDVDDRDAGLVGDRVEQLVERAAHGLGQLDFAARVHHDVGDPAHQVFAEADLRVHHAAGGDHLAGREVAEVGGDGRRADVDGDAIGLVAEAGIDVGDHLAAVDGD